MTPLIDVMLVLLIVFMVSIPTLTHSVTIENPSPAKGSPPLAAVIDLRIDFDGTMLWNGTVVDRGAMQTTIDTFASKGSRPDVHITVDRFAKYEVVAQALADLQSHGLRRIEFVHAP